MANIQFNTVNIIPTLSAFELALLDVEFLKYENKFGKNAKFFAFVNVLWYSLSDAEHPQYPGTYAFPKNFTIETLINLMRIGEHLWKNYQNGHRTFQEPAQSTVLKNGTHCPNEIYQAFMYLRDEFEVCHNLIVYVPSEKTIKLRTLISEKKWVLHYWDDVISETDQVHSLMTLQNVTSRNWL